MGLDQYLYATRYMGAYQYQQEGDPETQANYSKAIGAQEMAGLRILTQDEPNTSTEVKVMAAYWRKANQVHGWFVHNVQGGTDDCGSYNVQLEQLEQLINEAQAVIDKPERAPDRLPPVEGFFFGSYEVDEWYIKDLEYTVDRLTSLVKKARELVDEGVYVDFYYHSSW